MVRGHPYKNIQLHCRNVLLYRREKTWNSEQLFRFSGNGHLAALSSLSLPAPSIMNVGGHDGGGGDGVAIVILQFYYLYLHWSFPKPYLLRCSESS